MNYASSIPYIWTAEGISDPRVVTDFNGIKKWLTDHNNIPQNNPCKWMLSDLEDKIQPVSNIAQQYLTQVEVALQKLSLSG